ncbi:hypothetical protein [Falsibacillus pallidus]|uniref:Replication initiation factor n=1 Tax=Falsibacillus pallidus TaxID=493781 RepID=A0A370GCJ5_9BACI|nr:hypothetical protein [Falsibacillus pallidus]RDI40906.1 hypothetical protein DFR59_11149 [Falsibacillus pallidus]
MTKLKSKVKYKKEESCPLYKVKLCIDTFILVGKLTEEQQEELFDHFILLKREWYQDRYFHYSIRINNIVIKYSPRNLLAWNNYNTMIIIEKNTSITYIPHSVKEILKFNTWQIKRLDLAFDFSDGTPFSTFSNRLIMKHHGNVKLLQISKNDKDWNSEYVGTLKTRTESKACCYDRNKKEEDYGSGVEHEYPLRFEIRLFPKLNEFNYLNQIDHGWIENKLSKFIFITDIENLPLNKWDKRKLYKVQADYDYFKGIEPSKQKALKKVINSLRVPFEDIYSSRKDTLFLFLDLPPIHMNSQNQYYEQLTLNDFF